MTFVGKILVILIMAFSLVFLGVSTVVFSTATNWKTVAEKSKADLAKAQSKVSDTENRRKDADSKLEAAKADHLKLVTERDNRIKELDRKIQDSDNQATAARGQLELAQKNAQVALAEATARKGETDTLNETLTKAQTQGNQYLAQNLELTDKIRILERAKTTAEQNAKDLRTFKARAISFMQTKGISTANIDAADANASLPQVQGRVKAVNGTNRSVEITIGSNDGLKNGHILQMYRTSPRVEFLGRVKIVNVEPNKAVAEVIGGTVSGKKILEGDNVASSFNAQ